MKSDHPILARRLFATAGLRVSQFDSEPSEKVRGHTHEAAHALFLLRGEMAEARAGGDIEIGAGAARLSGADARHDIDFGVAGARCLVLHFEDAAVRASQFYEAERVKHLGASIAELLTCASDAPLAVLAILEALSELRRADAAPDWLREAWRILTDGDSAPPQVGHVAREIGVSREHLMRCFNKHFAATPSAARQWARLGFAARLLRRQHDMKIAEVAGEAGFNDQSHLTRAFRLHFGCAPAAFRAQIVA